MHTLRRSRSSASQCPTCLQKKLVLLGDANTGKTFLVYRINHNKYLGDEAVPMLRQYDQYQYEKLQDSYQVKLMLVDANQFYDRLLPLYCASTDVALMCFAIDQPDSLDNVLEYWKPRVLDVHCRGVPVILLGTKADLRGESEQQQPDKKSALVRREDALRVAGAIGAVSYLECSAKLADGVREVCDCALKLVVQAAKGAKADRRKSKCVLS